MLEAAVSKWDAQVALGWSAPAEGAAETMEVVVVGEAAQCGLGLRQAAEQVPVENLALKDLPESLDLAVSPGRRCARVRWAGFVRTAALASEQRCHGYSRGA